MDNKNRQEEARRVRVSAADLAFNREHPPHIANGDEQKYRRSIDQRCKGSQNKPSYLASYTKGMPHDDDSGLVQNPDDFQQFVKGIDSGDPRDFIDTPLGRRGDDVGTPEEPVWRSEKAQSACGNKGASVRAWESQGAGNTFDLEGPDAQAVTMPPAPALGSDELIAEMGEVYAQAILRDVPFTQIVDGSGKVTCKKGYSPKETKPTVKAVITALNKLDWFKNDDCCDLDANELARRRGPLTSQNAFRGITPGDDIGPYISQFLLAGNVGINSGDQPLKDDGTPFSAADGFITYGAVRVDQRVRYATPCDDHMVTWDEYLDVQEGADLRGMESYLNKPAYRFITTPRDLATYVHYDALYEAYLNACLIMLAGGVPFDPGLPFQRADYIDHQQAFAHFGGPHILSLVTEVATRALKAVRFQKFDIHRRLRPEALAARLTKHHHPDVKNPDLDKMVKDLKHILKMVHAKNCEDVCLGKENYLLPMAFCEGSPMHPSYGAGHATVAGACVTILKAFFDHSHPLNLAGSDTKAFVPTTNGLNLKTVNVTNGTLTVEGELNKLASNIAIGRDWAGVHYFSDYIESVRMGEKIAIGILEEQKPTYGENFSMTVPLYDGGTVRI